jgi:predicted nuclease of restriction endonuclease-like (RecB) superfamily
MRLFYAAYADNEKLAPMVREISWTKNILIFEKCKDDLEREFYILMTRKFGWTKNILAIKIETNTYENTLLNQTNFDQTVSEEIRNQAKLAVKDEYTFDFLELGEEHSERELERSLISKVEIFLREMGGMFTFAGSQYRIEVEGNEAGRGVVTAIMNFGFLITLVQKRFHRRVTKNAEKEILSEFLRWEF